MGKFRRKIQKLKKKMKLLLMKNYNTRKKILTGTEEKLAGKGVVKLKIESHQI